MLPNLIALLGNHQKLKDSIFYNSSRSNNKNEYLPLPYSAQANFIEDQNRKYQILNTPSINKPEELISIWNNLLSISQLEGLKFVTIIYCFMDSYQDIFPILNELHQKIGFQLNENDYILLTSSQSFVDQDFKLISKNSVQSIQIDPPLLQQIKEKKIEILSNPRPQINKETKEIADQKFNKIVLHWKEIIAESKSQVECLQVLLQDQCLSRLLEKLVMDFKSSFQVFDLLVNMRKIFDERKQSFIDVFTNTKILKSNFLYCTNQKCKFLYTENSSQQLERIIKIEIILEKPTQSQNICFECQQKLYYLDYFKILQCFFKQFQFRIIKNICQNYFEQDSKEILQVMFLSKEGDERTKIFSMIQKHYSSDQPIQRNQFFQSSVINHKYRFHNPPPFNFLKDIENTKNAFREYFQKNDIHFFFILVQYERNDIMLENVQSIIKKIHHLDRKRMALIVNQCQCKQEQYKQIEDLFTYFSLKSIIFLHQNDCPQKICEIVLQNLQNIPLQRFDFTNTIFKQVDNNQQLQEQLNEFSQQIRDQTICNLKMQLAKEEMEIQEGQKEIKNLENKLQQIKVQQQNRIQNHKLNQEKLKSLEPYKKRL